TRVSTLLAFDYDADGRDDLLWGDQGVVVFSREKLGDLRFEASERLFELEPDELLTIADVDGDGEKDLVRLGNLPDDSVKVRYRPGGGRRANLLKEVTDGVGKTIRVDYSDSISAGEPGPDGLVFNTYEPDFESHHNTIPIKDPGPLVAVHSEMLTPSAPPRVTHYTYGNARLDKLGRGSLGFE